MFETLDKNYSFLKLVFLGSSESNSGFSMLQNSLCKFLEQAGQPLMTHACDFQRQQLPKYILHTTIYYTIYYPNLRIIHGLQANVYIPPSTSHRLPSSVYQSPSTIHLPPSSFHHPPTTIDSLTSTVYHQVIISTL